MGGTPQVGLAKPGRLAYLLQVDQCPIYKWNSDPIEIYIRSNVPFIKGFLVDKAQSKHEARLQDDEQPELPSEGKPGRALRADALRNEDAILEAAKIVFVTAGVDAPVRDIAAKAGVGIGTLYRRFPKRSDLVAAVFRREVDACAAEAEKFAAAHSPGDALRLWLKRYTAFLATKKGLAVALFSGDPAFDALPAYFRERFEPCLARLLHTAATAGEIRTDIVPFDLLRGIGNLAATKGDDAQRHTQDMVNLLLDGLMYGARTKG